MLLNTTFINLTGKSLEVKANQGSVVIPKGKTEIFLRKDKKTILTFIEGSQVIPVYEENPLIILSHENMEEMLLSRGRKINCPFEKTPGVFYIFHIDLAKWINPREDLLFYQIGELSCN